MKQEPLLICDHYRECKAKCDWGYSFYASHMKEEYKWDIKEHFTFGCAQLNKELGLLFLSLVKYEDTKR